MRNEEALFFSVPKVNCNDNLHHFKISKQTIKAGISPGNCIYCNNSIIDWPLLHKREFKGIDLYVDSFHLDFRRHAYWESVIISKEDIKKYSNLSENDLFTLIVARLRKSVQKPRSEIFRDGTQTPVNKNLVFLGQHAAALCCRKCIKIWYGIDFESELTSDDIDFFAKIIHYYIQYQISRIMESNNE